MSHPTGLETRLREATRGEVLFDRFSRGRYATDASFYQVMPLGVLAPRDSADLSAALTIAREEGVSLLARGAGTSQSGQTVNRSLVLDMTRHLNRIVSIDARNRRCVVEPGVVLDDLNRALKPYGLWFPVDVSTASRATIGGMAGNNSCGTRSIRYGIMRDNIHAVEALLADGSSARFASLADPASPRPALAGDLLALGAREAEEIELRFPRLMRRVGGYNMDALVPKAQPANLADILVGSEGTLALFTQLELKLAPLIGARTVGVCHFARFHDAMDAAQHIVQLDPVAVELVDRTMLALARDIAIYRPSVERFVRGDPDALLVVEFAETDPGENRRRLTQLGEVMGGLGFGWDRAGHHWGGVLEVEDPNLQAAITEVRQGGLNIMMSMREAGKPVSFVEDCAVPLEHLAEYTASLTRLFERHGTHGTWYAHASVGCLHVRPVLNLKLDKDVRAMRAIAEEAFALVRAYKGSHSGEHGDGIVRSQFHETMFGPRIVRAFEMVKDRFDPDGLFNPGRIIRPPRMDDRRLFRYGPDYRPARHEPALDWSGWSGTGDGFLGAVEMCNNNGACRKRDPGVMCPSYRVTGQERDVTRGRANTLRLALTGQLGADALTSEAMMETLGLCVSCKGCKRECPTGVDMARMKIEVLAARAARGGLTMRERLVAYLPRYAPHASRIRWLMHLRDQIPGAARLSETLLGLAARRKLPTWHRAPFRPSGAVAQGGGPEVVLLADTFNTWFEPDNLRAAAAVLEAGGYRVHHIGAGAGRRPLCCGRTFLSVGLVDAARAEAERLSAALEPYAERAVALVGLEPSCLFTLKDEFLALLPGERTRRIAANAVLFEEFVASEARAGRLNLRLRRLDRTAHLHGHCHQKAFGAMGAAEAALALVPGLKVNTIASSCCGMAGAFGYQAETFSISMAMAELSLLPALRAAEPEAIVVAGGTSCRQQIETGTGRQAIHVARLLEQSIIRQ